jgi:hypothetical protein
LRFDFFQLSTQHFFIVQPFKRIIVVGTGASGMMAAERAAEMGADILLLEKTDRPGNKILLRGKSRCNLTNAWNLDGFLEMYGSNGRFFPKRLPLLLSR